jgi:hypothetical protein
MNSDLDLMAFFDGHIAAYGIIAGIDVLAIFSQRLDLAFDVEVNFSLPISVVLEDLHDYL